MGAQVAVRATGRVDPDRVWALLASTARWPDWAPHMSEVTDADGATAPSTVHPGLHLRIRTVVPGVVLPVTIVEVDAPRSWTMHADVGPGRFPGLPVGRIEAGHVVAHAAGLTAVDVTMTWVGPTPLGHAVLQPYRPLARLAVRRLLALAAAAPADPTAPADPSSPQPADPT